MFGDVPIFGSYSFKIDEKGRMFLPSMTNAEKGDQVVFSVSDAGNGIVEIYPLKSFSSLLNKYDDILLTSTNSALIERIESEKRKLCSSAITQSNVDAQRRIFINPGILTLLGSTDARLYAQGEGNRIMLFGSEEGYEKYTGHSFIKVV